MIVAVPFLVITFFVYTFAKDLGSLHGKIVISYIFSVALLHISLAIVQLDEVKLMDIPSVCITAGYFIYASILICFFWLNVLCYDVLACFR
jgi:hypothetical protein